MAGMEAGVGARHAGARAGVRHAGARGWMADEACGGGFGVRRERGWHHNRMVGMEAGAWLCLVYTIVLRISRVNGEVTTSSPPPSVMSTESHYHRRGDLGSR
jgi:hypothetical protein